MKIKDSKRLLSTILALVMVFCFLPTGDFAFAYNNGDAQPAVEAEDVDQADQTEDEVVTGEGSSECDHSWGKWKVTKDPTCTKEGERERVCDTCGATETETVDKTDHNWDKDGLYCKDCKILKSIAEGGSYDFKMAGEKWVIEGKASADVEDAETWKDMFANLKFTDNWAENLVKVAETQVGYKESSKNFAISEDLDRNGYTRYGEWAGEPYGDWSEMFVAFCLHFADVSMPTEDSSDEWISKLDKEGMFAAADGYVPRAGDLIFFDRDKDGVSDSVGIVESYNEDTGVIDTIEGDYKDEVVDHKVNASDSDITGYGILPENPDVSKKDEPKQEEKSSRSLKKGEPTRDGYPPGYDPNSQASVAGYERFGDPTNDPRISVEIVENGFDPANDNIMAGDTLNYTVRYSYLEIPELNFGYPKAMPFYDKYKNNIITITLPAGMLLAGQESPATDIQTDPNNQDPNVAHTYTFSLPDVTANDQKQFGISVYVCNNGTDKSVASYNPIQITSHTEFDVIDYTGGNEKPVGHYTQDVSASSKSIQTMTPDKWGVEKTAKEGYPKIDGNKAIFAWEVKVGLLDNNGNVITDVSKYKREGRDAVESIKLQDTLDTIFSKDNSHPTGTLTISKASGGSKTFTSGTAIELKDEIALDVSADADRISTNGSSDPAYLIRVPTLTTYTVTAEYPVTPTMIAEFYQNPYELDSTNKAKISEYKLADIPAAVGNETAEIPEELPLGLTDPAAVTVGKSLREFAAGNVTNPYDDRYGAIAFKISRVNGGEFTVYKYRANPAPHYIPVEGMENVTEATLVKGTKYYLAPDHQYKVVESLTATQYGSMHPESTILNGGTPVPVPEGTQNPSVEFTPAAKSNNTVTFVNKEVRGKIIIVKKDNANPAQPIKGAKFTVQRIDAQGNPIGDPINTDGTGDDGKITVKNLPFGTYKVTETYVKEGYVMDPTPQIVEVADGKTEQQVTLTFTNKINGATLTLTKWVAISEATFKTKANANFTGTFKLYRSTDKTTWEEVPLDSNRVNSNGVISKVLPPFTSDGTPYWYKFRETIPDGFYDPATGSTTTAETEPITLTEEVVSTTPGEPIIIAKNQAVNMYNRKLVKAHIQKKFYSVGADGKLAFDKDQSTTATLYKYVGNDTSVLTPVQSNFDIGGGDSGGDPTWVNFYDLKLYDGSNRIHYLIKEDSVDGYLLDWASITGTKKTIGGVDYIELAISDVMSTSSSMTNTPDANQPNMTAVLNNIEQKIPVKVVKYDYYTGKFVEGSKFSAYNAAGTTVINNTTIPSTGYTFNLTPGQIYTYKETTVPTNYYLHSYTDANGTSVANSNGDGTINLTGSDYVLKYADVGDDLTVERRIYNYQDPLIRIVKKDGQTNLNAKFTVYEKVTDSTGTYYKRVTEVDAIDSNVDSNVRLPAGEYYIHESTVPDGYLDPDKHYDLYHDLDSNYIKGHTGSASGPEKVLRKVTVTNGKMTLLDGSGTDNICKFDFVNIKNKGSLKVLKKVYDTLTQGFTIVVKKKNDQGELVEVARKNTDRNGAAVFDDLPVYDDNGQLIQYTITEELSSTQEPVYYQASANQTATLKTTGQTTKDTSNKDLVVVNHTKVKVDVRKVFRNTWDYVFTHMDYPMEDAIIGLFVKEGDNWVKVADSATTNPATTNEDGYASFTGLRRDKEYAFVELSSGNDNYFPYNVDGSTYEDKWKLKYPPEGVTSIPDSDIGKYNVRFITPDQMSDKTKIEFTVNKDLVNANHWVQFDITKWLDHDTYNPSEGESPIYGGAVNKAEDTKYDNAVFKLYRYIMPDDTDSVEFMASGWSLVGTYTTGTKYDENGVRQIGEFMTNVEQNVNDHYVYMLVETDAGPNGGVINPKFKYTFWQANGKNYTVTLSAALLEANDGYTPRQMNYTMDQVNEDDILNAHPVGPGTGVIYLASIRIAKWQDVLDPKTGEWKKEYTPLPNTEFEVRLNNKQGKVLTTLTTGLDATGDHPKAWAQSGTYQLVINANGTYGLKDYETGETLTTADGLVVEQFDVTKNGVTYHGFRIPVVLVETDCPDGYSYDTNGYDMYLCFFDLINGGDGTSWVFNDAFFATSATESYTLAPDGTQTAWYVTEAENYAGIPASFFLGDDQSIRRIVDYPIHNTFVTVHKYGYAPNADTISGAMTSTDLDKKQSEEINREPLPGVTMYLQHRKSDGSWEFWDYKLNKATTTAADAKFVTTEGGGYIFPDGLKPGTYRIYETALPTSERSTIYDTADGSQKALIKDVYEMAYYNDVSGNDHTSANSHSRARIFTVGTDNKSVTMYNPKKVDLTLIKKDLDGNALSGTSFSLKYPTNNTASTGTTDADGKVVFRNITSRSNYWIVETKAGYSSEYLQQYLKSVDPSLANLAVAGTGARIGYTYTTKGNATSDRDTYVNLMAPNPLITGSASLKLTIKNPKKVNIDITKVDDSNNAITSGKAKFKAYYHPFTQDGNTFKFKNEFSSSPTSESGLTSAGFARYPDASTELETDSNGKIDLTNVDPGIYAFIETEAPAGYDVLKTTDGKDVIYFVIVKGGLDATVTGLAASVDTWAGSVTTLINGVVDEGVEKAVFSAKNYQQVTMKAKKELVYPAGADADSWTIYKPWEVRLDLYAADKTTVLGSASFTNTSISTTPVTFKKNGADVKLSKGETYYVKEAVVKPTAAFDLVKLLADGHEVTDVDENGFYKVTVEDEVVVTAQNKFLWGQVKFKKYDGKDVADNDFTKPLEGAEFEVRYNENAGIDGAPESWVKVPNSTVEYDSSTKAYIADIPLISEVGTKYRIYETKPPTDHLFNPDLYLEVEVPQMVGGKLKNVIDFTNSTDPDEYLVNTEGNNLTITKYDNLHGVSNTAVGQGEASFTVYHRKSADPEEWEVAQAQTGTNGDGIVTYLTTPGETYAIAETAHAGKFLGLDGIYRVTGEGSSATETELTRTVDITINGNTVTAYVIVSSKQPEKIVLKAYNKPLIKPMIVKQDAGGYPEDIVPVAFFDIYKVSANFVATDSSVEALVSSETPVYSGNTNANNLYTRGGTYGRWDAAENGGQAWDPTKRYLIVETKVASGTAGKDYNTLNKDDKRVEWYTVAEPVAEPDPDHAPVYILKNVYGDADAGIKKTVVNNPTEDITTLEAADTENAVVNGEVESLLTGKRKVVYTIKPSADSTNQALESYKVTDSGITFEKKKADYNDGPQPSYSITSIKIGKATQDTSKLDFTIPENTVVSAKVTFTLANGSTDVQTVDLTDEQGVDVVPNGKAKDFVIEYFSEGVSTATGGKYALGYDFNPGEITVNATINKLADGDADEPVNEVTKFTNHSAVDMVYPQWKDDGSGMVDPAPSVHETSDATINVRSLRMPKISVSKEATDGTTTIQHITLGSFVIYKVGISNTGDTDFINPVILDMLPTGVTFDPSYEVTYDSNTLGHNEQYKITTETRTGKVTQTYEGEGGVPMGDAETAVIFKLKSPDGTDGVIEAGSTIYLFFKANIKETAGMYEGDMIENDVFASTAERSFHTTDNPNGFGFTDTGGKVPGTLDQAAKALDENGGGTGTVAQTREGGLHEDLGAYAYNASDGNPIEYVWVPAKAEVTYGYASKITLKKAVWGDRDAGYEESKYFLGMSTRTNVPGTPSPLDYSDPNLDDTVELPMGSVGWTKWRLSVENGSPLDLTKVTMGDIIPKQEDGRLSSWESVWRKMLGTQMKVGPKLDPATGNIVYTGETVNITEGTGSATDANKYTIFFYVGDLADAIDEYDSTGVHITKEGVLRKALKETAYWNDDNHSISKPATDRDNWKTLDEITDYTTIKAFIIVFDKDFVFKKDSDLVASYQTTVANMTDGTQFNDEYAYKNDNNVFRMNYQGSQGLLTSNQVSVTLMDKPVSVEGDLWIDEDWDAVQNKGREDGKAIIDYDPAETRNGSRRDYSKYAIIQDLIDATKYTITDLRQGQGTSENDLGLDEYIGYGESVEHFRFEGLIPAAIAYKYSEDDPNAPLYIYDENDNLKKEGLRTFEPAIYRLNVEVRGEKAAALMNVFKITKKGTYYYKSNNPDIHNFTENIDNYVLDDNFFAATSGKKAASTEYETKPFFIRYSTEVDKTKDWGVQEKRDLEIEKRALDNPNVKIKGAKFEIYGSYGDADIGERKATETTASGAPLHFSLIDGVYHWAVQDEDNNWYLAWEGTPVEGTTETVLETDANGKIKVAGINFWKEYDIKEVSAPAGYDPSGAVVSTPDGDTWTRFEKTDDDRVFTLKVPDPSKTIDDGPDQILIDNPRPVKLTPEATKKMSDDSEPLPKDTDFKFVLTATNVVEDGSYYMDDSTDPAKKKFITAEDPATFWEKTVKVKKGETVCNVSFDDLYFVKKGTYEFEIKEAAGNDPHFEYDPHTWKYIVVVEEDTDNNKLVATGTYSLGQTSGTTPAVFENTYTPEPTSWQAEVQKVMDKDGEPTPVEKKFTFKMTATSVKEKGSYWEDASTSPVTKTIIKDNDTWTRDITVPAGSAGVTYPDPAEAFDKITFTKAGTYKFKIEEVKPDPALPGITYAEDYVEVTIVVTDPTSGTGKLTKGVTTKVVGNKGDVTVSTASDDLATVTAKFTNKYVPEPTSWQAEVQKVMVPSNPTVVDKKFTFKMTAKSVKEKGSYWEDASTSPATKKIIKDNDTWTREITVPAGSADGTYPDPAEAFDKITFTKAGTYKFKIEEVKPNPGLPGITYAEDYVEVTIEVTDPTSGTAKLTKDVTTKVVGEKGDVTVSTASDELATVSAKFSNKYKPKPIEFVLRVEKLLTGEPLYDAAGTEFKFQLIGNDPGDPPAYELKDPTEVTITGAEVEQAVASGNRALAKFGDIIFYSAGTYEFYITEVKEQDADTQHPNVIYDDTKWTATIEIEDNDGSLRVKSAVYKNDKDPSVEINAREGDNPAAVFTNDYTPGEETWQPLVEKIMSDKGDTTEKDATFTFRLTAEKVVENGCFWLNPDKKIIADGDALPDVKIKVPAGTRPGSVIGPEAFEWIHFTKKGVYVFNIVEFIPNNVPKGYTYAEGTATLTVTVDDVNGYMKVTNVATSTSDGAIGIGFAKNDANKAIVAATFTNGYTGDNPPTGDDMNLLGVLGAMTGSLIALLGIVFLRRREEE